MAILGGSVLPALQAMIIDSGVTAIPAVNLSFIVPALCFVVVMRYGLRHSR
jgi:FHS family L-fucose permease-like MFS transporter